MVAGMAIDDDDDFSDYDFSWHLNFKSREETRLEIYVFHHEWPIEWPMNGPLNGYFILTRRYLSGSIHTRQLKL